MTAQRLHEQEAQLPQRNSASAVHAYLGWLTDRAVHRTPHKSAPERHFSHPTSTLPQISPCSPGSRWMTFGLRRAKVLGDMLPLVDRQMIAK